MAEGVEMGGGGSSSSSWLSPGGTRPPSVSLGTEQHSNRPKLPFALLHRLRVALGFMSHATWHIGVKEDFIFPSLESRDVSLYTCFPMNFSWLHFLSGFSCKHNACCMLGLVWTPSIEMFSVASLFLNCSHWTEAWQQSSHTLPCDKTRTEKCELHLLSSLLFGICLLLEVFPSLFLYRVVKPTFLSLPHFPRFCSPSTDTVKVKSNPFLMESNCVRMCPAGTRRKKTLKRWKDGGNGECADWQGEERWEEEMEDEGDKRLVGDVRKNVAEWRWREWKRWESVGDGDQRPTNNAWRYFLAVISILFMLVCCMLQHKKSWHVVKTLTNRTWRTQTGEHLVATGSLSHNSSF